MTSLDKINETSLAKICFFNKSFDKFVKELDFYNIAFAANGVFVVLKNDFGVSIGKLKNIKYSNSGLKLLDEALWHDMPKPKLDVFIKIIEIFKYVYDKIKSEICVNVYFNKQKETFHINIEDQIVSGGRANYKYDEKFEMSSDYVRYLQIHSHHTMGAGFSSIDDRDEESTALCYYGVVGKLNENSSFYNVESKFRIWNGIKFVDIKFVDVFDLGKSTVKLEETDLCRLNKIIENSKKENAKTLVPIEDKLRSIGLPVIENWMGHDMNTESSFTDEFNELLGKII